MSRGNRVALSEMILQDILKKMNNSKKSMTWIKVTERLPEQGERVFCATNQGYVGVGGWTMLLKDSITGELFRLWMEEFRQSFHLTHGEVIAWMPLPEYKEDEG